MDENIDLTLEAVFASERNRGLALPDVRKYREDATRSALVTVLGKPEHPMLARLIDIEIPDVDEDAILTSSEFERVFGYPLQEPDGYYHANFFCADVYCDCCGIFLSPVARGVSRCICAKCDGGSE